MYSEQEATELPRYVLHLLRSDTLFSRLISSSSLLDSDPILLYLFPRAYVVSTQNALLLKDASQRQAFEKKIQAWVKSKVANHKQLRGGVFVIAQIPKSATGKILRKDLRALAAQEKTSEKAKAKL